MTARIGFIAFLFLFIVNAVASYSQGEFAENRETLKYNVNQYGAKINTDGFGFIYSFSQRVNYRLRRSFEAEYDYVKSLKELKMMNTFFSQSTELYPVKKFVYGKQNSVHAIRLGYGYNRMIFEKRDKNSVSIHLLVYVGLSFAIEKPIYYEIVDSISVTASQSVIYYASKYKFNDYPVSNPSDIITKCPFKYGLSEIKVKPGNYLKLGFSFDFAQDAMSVNAIEVGGIFDYYYMPLTIMYAQPKHFMWSFYISYQFGKKYNPSLNRDFRKEQRKSILK